LAGTFERESDDALAASVKAELAVWFGGDEVAAWQLLRVYRIPFAQPCQVMDIRV
jgi:hypothetical protein